MTRCIWGGRWSTRKVTALWTGWASMTWQSSSTSAKSCGMVVIVPAYSLVDQDTGLFASANDMCVHFERAGVLSVDKVIIYCGAASKGPRPPSPASRPHPTQPWF